MRLEIGKQGSGPEIGARFLSRDGYLQLIVDRTKLLCTNSLVSLENLNLGQVLLLLVFNVDQNFLLAFTLVPFGLS